MIFHDFIKSDDKPIRLEFKHSVFLLSAPEKTLASLKSWLLKDNRHVRAFDLLKGLAHALPWAMQANQRLLKTLRPSLNCSKN